MKVSKDLLITKSAEHFLFLIFNFTTFDTVDYPFLLTIFFCSFLPLYFLDVLPTSLNQSCSVSLINFLLLYSFLKVSPDPKLSSLFSPHAMLLLWVSLPTPMASVTVSLPLSPYI